VPNSFLAASHKGRGSISFSFLPTSVREAITSITIGEQARFFMSSSPAPFSQRNFLELGPLSQNRAACALIELNFFLRVFCANPICILANMLGPINGGLPHLKDFPKGLLSAPSMLAT